MQLEQNQYCTSPLLYTAGNVNVSAIGPLVEYFLAAGVKGLYLCGSTGSGIAMTKAERMLMTEETCKVVAGRVPVIVMVGACPVEDAVALAIHAKEVPTQPSRNPFSHLVVVID